MLMVGRARMATAGALGGALVGVVVLFGASESVGADPACSGRPTTSDDGTVVRGSPCADRIVVVSPLVRRVEGAGGDDVIFATANVEFVDGGPGDDVIFGEPPADKLAGGFAVPDPQEAPGGPVYAPAEGRRPGDGDAATISSTKYCEAGKSCYGGSGDQLLIGSSGNDKIFGQRGNDEIYGNSGDDALYGGVGDDTPVSGGSGNDLVSGGFGTERVNGNDGSDIVRGDATIDEIEDTGSSGTDTLSFATGVAPGFNGSMSAYSGFPADSDAEERGVSVRLDGFAACWSFEACNNDARYGGGSDEIAVSGFENVIGSPFADYIVGSNGANRIDGGGGADVILGNGGDDVLYGGADGDFLKGDEGTDSVYGQGGEDNCLAESTDSCAGSAESVDQRDRTKISVGYIATSVPSDVDWVSLYLTGAYNATDKVNAKYWYEGGTGHVTFTTESGSASFDTSADAESEGCTYAESEVDCTLPLPLDAIVLAGMGGDDTLNLAGGGTEWEDTVTPYLLGGQGSDVLKGSGQTEDVLVDGDGAGNDSLYGYGYDEALVNNEGADNLQGGNGNDLILSAATCGGDTLQGAEAGSGDGSAVNNTSWAKLPAAAGGVVADLEAETAGSSWSGGPACSSGSVDAIRNIDHLEGSSQSDGLYGDGAGNFILGRLGTDGLWGRGGNDTIQGHDGEADSIGGSSGTDTCHYDKAFDTRAGCEGGTGY